MDYTKFLPCKITYAISLEIYSIRQVIDKIDITEPKGDLSFGVISEKEAAGLNPYRSSDSNQL
jgi:hypothetical protein